MPTGKVKFYNSSKRFGFITPDDGNLKDLFVHQSEVAGGTLKENDLVQFEIGEGQKGPCAKSVTIIK